MDLSDLRETGTYKDFENKLNYGVELYGFQINEKLRKLSSNGKVTDTRYYEEYKMDLAPKSIRNAIDYVKGNILSQISNYEDVMKNATGGNVFTGTLELIEIMRKFKILERRIEIKLLDRIRKTYKIYFDLQEFFDKEYLKDLGNQTPKKRSRKSKIGHISIGGLPETDTRDTPKKSAKGKRSKRIPVENTNEVQV